MCTHRGKCHLLPHPTLLFRRKQASRNVTLWFRPSAGGSPLNLSTCPSSVPVWHYWIPQWTLSCKHTAPLPREGHVGNLPGLVHRLVVWRTRGNVHRVVHVVTRHLAGDIFMSFRERLMHQSLDVRRANFTVGLGCYCGYSVGHVRREYKILLAEF